MPAFSTPAMPAYHVPYTLMCHVWRPIDVPCMSTSSLTLLQADLKAELIALSASPFSAMQPDLDAYHPCKREGSSFIS